MSYNEFLSYEGLKKLWEIIKSTFVAKEEGKGLSSKDFTLEYIDKIEHPEKVGDFPESVNIIDINNNEDTYIRGKDIIPVLQNKSDKTIAFGLETNGLCAHSIFNGYFKNNNGAVVTAGLYVPLFLIESNNLGKALLFFTLYSRDSVNTTYTASYYFSSRSGLKYDLLLNDFTASNTNFITKDSVGFIKINNNVYLIVRKVLKGDGSNNSGLEDPFVVSVEAKEVWDLYANITCFTSFETEKEHPNSPETKIVFHESISEYTYDGVTYNINENYIPCSYTGYLIATEYNAFSNVKVGTTTITSDSKTDTLTLEAGSNVTLTPDATNDKITITAKDTTYGNVSTDNNGLMLASDKIKLDSIASNSEKNTIVGIKRNDTLLTPDSNRVINISVPTKTSELTNDSTYLTSSDVASTITGLSLNTSTGVITVTRKNGTTFTIDLPIEKVIKNGYYDSKENEIVLVLADDSEIRFSASKLINSYHGDDSTIELYTDTNDSNKKKFRITTSYKNKIDNSEQTSNRVTTVDSSSLNTKYPTALAVWNAIKNFATNTQTFTQATTRTNIETGETISTIFGKIKKWFSDLKTVAFTGSYNDLSNKPTIGSGEIIIKQAGTQKGSFKLNDTTGVTIELSDNNTTYSTATTTADGLMSSSDKTKLQGIASGAEVNVQSDWSVTNTSSDAYIKNKPTIPTVNNATVTIKQAGVSKGSFTLNQSTGTTIELTDNNTTYKNATTGTAGLMSADDKSKLEILKNGNPNGVLELTNLNWNTYVLGDVLTLDNNCTIVKISSTAGTSKIYKILFKSGFPTNGRRISFLMNDAPLNIFYGGSGDGCITSYLYTHNEKYNLITHYNQDGTNGRHIVEFLYWGGTWYDKGYLSVPNNATSSLDGLLSASDKQKLDSIAWGAQVNPNVPIVYNPKITIKQGGTEKGSFTLNQTGATTIELTDNNTTYNNATTSASGLMSASDKSKLDGITSSADSVSFTRSLTSGTKVGTITINGTGTDLYAPTNTDTTYGVVSTTANGLAPKRDGSTTKFLRGDGTWAVPPDTNTKYSNFVKSGSEAKAGLVPAPSTTAGTTKFLREDGTWNVPTMDFLSNGTSDVTDDTLFLTSRTDGIATNTTIYKRPATFLWNYIKSKISSVLGLTSSNYGGTAAKATKDGSGNTITSTYATKTELTNALTKSETWKGFGNYNISDYPDLGIFRIDLGVLTLNNTTGRKNGDVLTVVANGGTSSSDYPYKMYPVHINFNDNRGLPRKIMLDGIDTAQFIVTLTGWVPLYLPLHVSFVINSSNANTYLGSTKSTIKLPGEVTHLYIDPTNMTTGTITLMYVLDFNTGNYCYPQDGFIITLDPMLSTTNQVKLLNFGIGASNWKFNAPDGVSNFNAGKPARFLLCIYSAGGTTGTYYWRDV